jgi:hypothetical protein
MSRRTVNGLWRVRRTNGERGKARKVNDRRRLRSDDRSGMSMRRRRSGRGSRPIALTGRCALPGREARVRFGAVRFTARRSASSGGVWQLQRHERQDVSAVGGPCIKTYHVGTAAIALPQ